MEFFRRFHLWQKEENRFLYQAAQYQLLAIFSRHKKQGKITDEKQFTPAKQAVSYIHEHLGEALSAAVLAQPDIMRMNQFEYFTQPGYPAGVLND